MNKRNARIIAIYLPQYHPIPENDLWWGKGFTEWTNVGKAKPLFLGHYQPRVPADLGYYDLRLPESRCAQAALAREAGVEGFMYWHYYFGNGKELLQRPFNEVLRTGAPDFPFCLGWANHSWTTRTWTKDRRGRANQTIIEQSYPGEDDHISHFFRLLPAFRDRRYIRVNGEPIFVIYQPLAIPEVGEFIRLWKRLADENGLGGLHMVALTGGWLENYRQAIDAGYDAIIPGNMWHAECQVKGKWKKLVQSKIRNVFPEVFLDKYRYEDIIANYFTDYDHKDYAYPSIVPQWDRSPRSGRKAIIYTGSTPDLFEKHIRDALGIIEHKPEEKKIVFLRSWNEWAEGNYVEPDLRFGHGYLDALRKCIVSA